MASLFEDPGQWFEDTLGPLTGSSATRDAIEAQARATEEANATQRYMYDQTRADLSPFREIGTSRLSDLVNPDFQRDFTMADFQRDPGYQFRLQEGMKALEGSAAARGMLNSGATLKALTRYGQDFAANEYQNAYNRFNADRDRRFGRLNTLANIGLQAAGQQINANSDYANQVSANQMAMANANAAAHIAQANRQAGLLGAGITGTALYLSSDKRLKTDIVPVSKEDLEELRSAIKPYHFKYISSEYGEGDWVGVMAQDLEKSKLGKTVVVEDEQGFKRIDMSKLMALFLAMMSMEAA